MTKDCTLSHTFLPFCFSAEIVNQGDRSQILCQASNALLNTHKIYIDLQCNAMMDIMKVVGNFSQSIEGLYIPVDS